MKVKQITPDQYADYLNCTVANISKHVRNNKMTFLPNVLKINRFSRFYTFDVPDSLPVRPHEEIVSEKKKYVYAKN